MICINLKETHKRSRNQLSKNPMHNRNLNSHDGKRLNNKKIILSQSVKFFSIEIFNGNFVR